MLFKASHCIILLFFLVAIVFAGITVSKLRNASASSNASLFTFGYFSLAAWILWIVQYGVRSAPFLSFESRFSLATVLWLGVVQNALWACAVLSRRWRRLSQKSLTVPLLIIVSVAIAALAYQTDILTSASLNAWVALSDATFSTVFSIVLAIWIVQLQLSKISAAVFLLHGYSQWMWRWFWLAPLGTTRWVEFGFPLWRIILFFAWSNLISTMAQRIQPAAPQVRHAQEVPMSWDLGD